LKARLTNGPWGICFVSRRCPNNCYLMRRPCMDMQTCLTAAQTQMLQMTASAVPHKCCMMPDFIDLKNFTDLQEPGYWRRHSKPGSATLPKELQQCPTSLVALPPHNSPCHHTKSHKHQETLPTHMLHDARSTDPKSLTTMKYSNLRVGSTTQATVSQKASLTPLV
jgi:hypothetical protein